MERAFDQTHEQHVQFYQHLTDIIRVVWETFSKRITHGYAAADAPSSGKPSTVEYISGIESSVKLHTAQFLRGAGSPVHHSDYAGGLQELSEDIAQVARDDFMGEIVQRAQGLSMYRKQTSTRRKTLDRMIREGFGTAAIMLTMSFGKHPETMLPALAKVDIKHIEDIEDMTASGQLYAEKLREYGAGRAVGCPASQRQTPECNEFLQKHGLRSDRTTIHRMIEDVTAWYAQEMKRYETPATPLRNL